MRFTWIVALTSAGLLFSGGDGSAFTSSLTTKDKTVATPGASVSTMSPYGERIYHEIISEIRKNEVPFLLKAPVDVVVLFGVNRRGELVHVSVPRKTRSKLIDDYAAAMVRQASRRFPAPPDDLPGEVVSFTIPIRMG